MAPISCAVTAQLICAFVFAYSKNRFSHDATHSSKGFSVGGVCGHIFFELFNLVYMFIVVAICDLVQDLETIHGLC